MSESVTPAAPAPAFPADAVCVLVTRGTRNILGGNSFQTYSPDGAKKAATKLENVHKEQNVKLSAILAKDETARSDDEKSFLKEYGSTAKPTELDIRVIDDLTLNPNTLPRNLPKPPVVLTPEQKAEKRARLAAQLAALDAE